MTPVGLPVLTMIPSRTVNVFDATWTGTQPLRSRALKRGTQSFSAAVAWRRKRKLESSFKWLMGGEYQGRRANTRQNRGEKRKHFSDAFAATNAETLSRCPLRNPGKVADYSRGA